MIILACLLSFIGLSSSECVLDSSTPHISKEASLHKHLIANYKISKQPTRMKNVSVNIRFLLKTFQFFNEEEEFLVHSWVFVSWHDDCLTWKPEEYDSIDNTLIKTMHIWTPQIAMDNELAFEYGIFYSPLQRCQVFHTGLVACVPRVTDIVTCNSVLDNWPYDIQTCNLIYTIKNNVSLSYPSSKPITMLGAEYGTGWTIVAYAYTHPENLKDKFTLSITVERTAALLAAINVSPAILIAVLGVGALFIDVRNTLRVYLLCFCLACNFTFVQIINENIPKGGVGSPKVLMFLRNSILMTAISVVVTFALKNLRKYTKPTPTWVIQINDFVTKDARKKFIWPKWEADCCEDESTKKIMEDWNTFSFVSNFFLLIAYLLCYFILFLIYIPNPTPVTI
ncbi:acetylcholine receptor subunit beta-like [Aricia agestis]|uniref:acetylcholine receptor subunit beta-like n=1 Tax=Aricia agestis TaxID=91739 RepID=UPI001C2077BE|nr:acetylcholine receptor subunit beta-like [Aricia agestis]